MKHVFGAFFWIGILFIVASPLEARFLAVELVLDDYQCDGFKMIFHDGTGYIVAEWFSGIFIPGSIYFGEFNSYGMVTVYDQSNYEIGTVWIEDYWVSSNYAAEACYSN